MISQGHLAAPRTADETRLRVFRAACRIDTEGIIAASVRRNAELEYHCEEAITRPGEYRRSLAEIRADFTRRRAEDLFYHYSRKVRSGAFPLEGESVDEDALRHAIGQIEFWDRQSRRDYHMALPRIWLARLARFARQLHVI